MAYKLHQHSVITGSLNSFCLACESFLRTDKETTVHLEKPLHQKNLAMTPYFGKFEGDGIRKVKMGYYCEYCNTLLPIASKVTLHVAESSHVNNRGALSLRPTGLDVIAFDNVLIQEEVWHGLTEESVCLVCNTEFEDENLHKSSLAHGLNLVQKRVEFGPGNSIYRQVDDTTFQCITCHIVLASNTLTDHLNDSEHLKLYEKCRNEYKDITSEIAKDVLTATTEEKKEPTEIGEASAEVKEIANKDSTSTNTNKTGDDKLNVVDTNNKTTQKVPSEDATSYAQRNQITFSAKDTTAFCGICKKRFPSNLQSMKEHVGGGPHLKKLLKINSMPKFTKEPMKSFVKGAINIGSLFGEDTVVDEKYCMAFYSFLTLTPTESGLRCQICEVNVRNEEDDVDRHCRTSKHEKKMNDTPVVTSIRGEFIREVRQGLFHCGYCNIVVGSWEVVNDHLDSTEHKESRHAAESRLERHRPSISRHVTELRDRAMLMHLLMLRRQF